MSDIETSSTGMFRVSGDEYDRYMGRYSLQLAPAFADVAGVEAGHAVLDVGCGPGALTAELVRRLGPERVAAVEPSEPFVEACRCRHPEVDVRRARAEKLPHPDDRFDAAAAQLVLHFVDDPGAAAGEMRRVVRPGGVVAGCVWDQSGGMRMLRLFWDAARELDPDAPDEAQRRFGRDGEIAELFDEAGLRDVRCGALDIEAGYADFEDFWNGFLTATGPAGSYLGSADADRRGRLREALSARLGSPEGPFTLPARAWYATGRV
jgi:SAM-dependent methyltransferase